MRLTRKTVLHRAGFTTVLLVFAFTLAEQAVPAPLVEFALNGDLRNSGALGGEGELKEYVPGEGPVFAPGVRGMGISFEASSRSGGSGTDKAGGAIVYEHPNLAALRNFTISTWFLPVQTEGPARLLFSAAWDLWFSGGRITFKLKREGKDYFLPMPPESAPVPSNEWSFVAVSTDFDAGKSVMYLARPGESPMSVATWESPPEPDAMGARVDIGNLDGIRPFKGLMDNVRIFNTALSPEQVTAMHAQDRPRTRTVFDCAIRQIRPQAPDIHRSDVFFSTRWNRPEAPDVIRSFGANRVVWVYTNDGSYVQKLRAEGRTVQGAINSIPRTDDLSAYCVDLDGTKLVAPWMTTFDPKNPVKWGCNNQPAYREAVLAAARKTLDAGVDWMQFDDWALIVSAHSWGGGCMCDRCMEAFREYLGTVPIDKRREIGAESLEGYDYRAHLREQGISTAADYKARRRELPGTPLFEDFQRKSVRSFFLWLREQMDAHAGRRVPLSANSNLQTPSQQTNFLADEFDFLIGETWSEALPDLAICARAADALATWQVVSPFPHNVLDTRAEIAATYALGHFTLVPWDIWMGPGKDRHFGKLEDYGDLYSFVRGNAALLDGFETVATVGVVIDTDRYDRHRTQRIVSRLLASQVPFRLFPSGRSCFEQHLTPEELQTVDLVVLACDPDALPEADTRALEAARNAVPVLLDHQVSDRLLLQVSPVELWGPQEIYCLLRAPAGGTDRRIACHILNRNRMPGSGAVAPLRYLSVALRNSFLGGAQIHSASFHAPGHEPEAAVVDPLPGRTRIVIPRVDQWGILLLELE
ncbi:MAG: LamG domain-containing protein [Armatimonadetes bacterium]|nr:LamG domain-containing protein [Armatimonadota bacterium]